MQHQILNSASRQSRQADTPCGLRYASQLRCLFAGLATGLLMTLMMSCGSGRPEKKILVLVSANAEWRALKAVLAPTVQNDTPYGEWFLAEQISATARLQFPGFPQADLIFLHGGWGKIDAAGSTQYAIDRWQATHLINIGTAGGFSGRIQRHDLLYVNRTITYDVIERMGSAQEALDYYSKPVKVLSHKPAADRQVGLLISADQDIDTSRVAELMQRFPASAADWESSAIAHVASKNGVPIYILRGVSDVVSSQGSKAYGNADYFEQSTQQLMHKLLEALHQSLSENVP